MRLYWFFILFSLLLALGLYQLFPSVGKGRESSLFAKYPISSQFKLKAGDSIAMPWHVYDARSVMLIGEVQQKHAVESFLKDLGLFPFESGNGLPLISVGAIQYLDGVAGPYNETFISCFASKSPSMKSALLQYTTFLMATNPHLKFIAEWLGFPEIYLVVWKMQVDTDLSLRGGREVWGYPKDMAQIEINERSQHPSVNEVKLTIDGTNVFTLKKTPPSKFLHSIFLSAHLIGHTVTPRRFLHSFGESEGFFIVNIKPFVKEEDSITFNPASELGKELSNLEFVPWIWYDSPKTEMVLKSPYYYE